MEEALCKDLRELVKTAVPAFDPGQLAVDFNGRVSVPVNLTLQYTIAIEGKTPESKGPLPPGVQAVTSAPDLRSILDERVALAREEAGPLMDAWAQANAGDYRREPDPKNLVRERPPFGMQDVCGPCAGHAQTTCPRCSGAKQVTCSTCSGRGHTICNYCSGTAQLLCSSCGGKGTVDKVEWVMSAEEKHQTASQTTQVRQVPCGSCSGGKVRCSSCSSGRINCASCAGSGRGACSTCRAAGTVPCENCGASGKVHCLGRVACAVEKNVRMEVGGGHAEDRQTLAERAPLENLAEFGKVKLNGVKRNGAETAVHYSVEVPVESVRMAVAGKSFEIRAYGPSRRIYFYHQLLEIILEPDLAALEGPSNGGAPVEALKRFLSAGVNADLAQRSANFQAHYLETGLVSENYARRAGAAIEQSARGLYDRMARSRLKWVGGGAAGLFLITAIAQKASHGEIWLGTTSLILTAGSWLFVEWRIRRGISGSLGEALYSKTEGRLRETKKKYRWMVGGGAAALWMIARIFLS